MISRTVSDSHPARIELYLELRLELGEDLSKWLESMSAKHNLRWLLAHVDDGVVWGRFDDGHLVLSSTAADGDSEAIDVCPLLRNITLQRLRAFGEQAEVFLWREDDDIRVRLIQDTGNTLSDGSPPASLCIDEHHILWGTSARELKNGFSLLTEEGLGIKHVVPLEYTGGLRGSGPIPQLQVRQYLEEDPNTGAVRIVTGRLVNLELRNAR